ncbi:hypothetical protein BGX24_008064 [Mortierella sp. AD032]|nr:hypothetical protein BGX24_008064 [Mortierella sp. AD032]
MHDDNVYLINTEGEPSSRSAPLPIALSTIGSTSNRSSNMDTNNSDNTAGPDTVSVSTVVPSIAAVWPGSSSEQAMSKRANSAMPLMDSSGDSWMRQAPSSEDNSPAEVSTPPNTAPAPTIHTEPSTSSIPVIDLTADKGAEDNSESMETAGTDTSAASGSTTTSESGQKGRSKPSSKSLPLTVRLRLQAAEALERRKKAQLASAANRSTPPSQGGQGPASTSNRSTPPSPSNRSSMPPTSPSTSPPLRKNQQETEVLTETQQQERQQLLSNRATNPLDLPEIRSNIARFLTRRDLRSCLLVSEGWWQSFQPALWMDLRPVYKNVLGGANDYPSARMMHKNSHLIRVFEYNGHGSVLTSMVPSMHGQYKNDRLEWRKSRAEEEAEENWIYVDEDVATDGDMNMDLDESLANFERRVEGKRNERLEQKTRMQAIITANNRQNELSRFLNDDTDYSKRYCHQLERLILTDRRFSREWGCHYKYWLRLMQLNSETLYALELHYAIRSLDALRDVYAAVFALGNLRDLVLVDNDIDAPKTKVFLEMVCPRLRRLELKKVRIEFGPFPNQPAASTDCAIMAMPQMKSLILNQVHARSSAFGLDFIKMCPSLVELDFRPQWGMAVKTFADTLAQKLPSLTHLSFRMQGLSDLDVSSIIKAVPELQKLDISGCVFGMMSGNNLTTRHLLSITYIDIRSCAQVTGILIQRVLGECRNLRVFLADHIRAKDIINNSVYPDWACIGLKELTIDIRGCPQDRELTTKVYRQLAALECLEYLDISRTIMNENAPTDTEGKTNILTLGLGHGLKMLRTLKHLHTLIFRGISDNDFGLVELQWVVLAWPRLGNLGGKLVTRKRLQYNPGVHPYTAMASTGNSSSIAGSRSGDGSTTTSGTDDRPGAGFGNGDPGPSSRTLYTMTATPSSTAFVNNNNTNNQAGGAAGASTDGGTSEKRFLPDAPAGLLGTTLRQLNLHRRIQVIPHPEDKISFAARKKRKLMLIGDSSDEERERERDRPRIGQLDSRYRLDFRD